MGAFSIVPPACLPGEGAFDLLFALSFRKLYDVAKKRYTFYLDEDIYTRCRALLEQSPTAEPFSHLVNNLLSDWYFSASVGPELAAMSPEEREVVINREAVRQFLELGDEVDKTLRKAREGAVKS